MITDFAVEASHQLLFVVRTTGHVNGWAKFNRAPCRKHLGINNYATCLSPHGNEVTNGDANSDGRLWWLARDAIASQT